jgi:hypothetical protein
MGVNKTALTRVQRIVPYFESIESVGKVTILRHGFHHLESCNIYKYELQLHLHCIFIKLNKNQLDAHLF